jgi:hypothetical protein
MTINFDTITNNYEVIYVIKTVMKYYLNKIDASFHQRLPNIIIFHHSFDHINNFIIICDRIKINCHHMFIRNPMMCVKDRKYI